MLLAVSSAAFRWIKGKRLGKGAFASVYLALDRTSGRILAVKQVEIPQTPSDRADPRQRQMVLALKREDSMLKGLVHKNVVHYLGFEQTSLFLNMQVVICLTRTSCFQIRILTDG